MAYENISIHGTFHLKLNLTITGEFEDLDFICQDDFHIKHDALTCANDLMQVTVGWVMPKKKHTIKQHLEEMYNRFPTNLNVIANLISVYNSLLLVKKSNKLQNILLELTQGNSPEVSLRKSCALAERAYVLVGDVASQEKTDDIGKLKTAIEWFEKAINIGIQNDMTEEECFIWKFFLAKTRYRVENRYRFEDNQTAERSQNFVQMLNEFAEIYEAQEVKRCPEDSEKPMESACRECETAGNEIQMVASSSEGRTSTFGNIYSNLKALALAYLADAFSITNAADRGKKVFTWNPPKSFTYNTTLQYCNTDPCKAYEEALKLSDNYKIKNRFARAFMNWNSFEKALLTVSESTESTKNADKLKSNWFGYATLFQIYCKQYRLSWLQAKRKCTNLQKRRDRFQDAKITLRKALMHVDDCPYRSASTLNDIADIYYYLGIDPETEENIEEKDLEKSLEYLMMARERLEGYKNPRTHARLAHCLWALGSWRPAVECMKFAIEMERPGFTKNFTILCKYMFRNSEYIAATEFTAILELAKEKYKEREHDEEMKELLVKLEEYSHKESTSFSEGYWTANKDPPLNAKNDGYTYDFIILHAEKDKEFAVNLLQRLENHLPTPYKGYLPDRDIPYGQSQLNLEKAIQLTKKIIVIVSQEFLLDQMCIMYMEDIICYIRDYAPMHRSPTDVNRKPNIIPIILEQDCYLPYGASLLVQPIYCIQNKKLRDDDTVHLMHELDH